MDELRYHRKPDGARCILTFDDSTVSHYEKAARIMREFGFTGFASLPTYYHENDAPLDMLAGVDEADQDPMTIEQMRELQDRIVRGRHLSQSGTVGTTACRKDECHAPRLHASVIFRRSGSVSLGRVPAECRHGLGPDPIT